MIEVSTSVLDVEEENSVKTFYNIETAKTDFFHIDVMDGKFVERNNLEKMKDYALKIHSISMVPLDVHLMVEEPRKILEDFIDLGVDRISYHLEACRDNEEVLNIAKYLIENGVKVGVAVNPDTDIENVYDILPYVHMILIMSVFPGKGGQEFIETSVEKIKKLKEYCTNNDIDIDIEVDGGVNDITASKAVDAGANILVSGKYIISSDDYSKQIKHLKGMTSL